MKPLRPFPVAALLLALLLLALARGAALAQEPLHIQGRVANGTPGEAAPAALEVTLHIIAPNGAVTTKNVLTDAGGGFDFPGLLLEPSSVYVLSASYLDVTYSLQLDPSKLSEPATLQVFETTDDIEAVKVDSHLWFIRGANGSAREVAAFELVTIANRGDRTFRPNQAQQGPMNLLRFSLPTDATGLDVRSDLQEGAILDVGTGFGLSTPIPPGSHQIAFTYQFHYSKDGIELTRSFPLGAATFQLIVPEQLAQVRAPQLTELPVTSIEGRNFRVWRGKEMGPGFRLSIGFSGLPQPSFWQRLKDGFSEGPYLRLGLPSALGLALLALLLYALLLRRDRPGVPTAPPVAGEPPLEEDRTALIAAAARLDDLFDEGALPGDEYRRRRAELKARLLRLAAASPGSRPGPQAEG